MDFSKEGLAMDSFFLHCQAKALSDKTLSVYEERLNYLRRYLAKQGKSLVDFERGDVQKYLLHIMNGNDGRPSVAGVTANGRLKVYRQFYKHLIIAELIEDDPTEGVPWARSRKRVKEVVDPRDFKRVVIELRKYGQKTWYTKRMEVLLLFSWDCMLRLNELLSIKVGDVQFRTRTLKVLGKGNKERIVGFSPHTATRLLTYMSQRTARRIPGDLLFPSRQGKKITHRNAHHMFERAGNFCQPSVKISPHLLRHSSATAYYDVTNNIMLLKDILGHEDVRTTQKYLHGSEKRIIKAYQEHTPVSELGL